MRKEKKLRSDFKRLEEQIAGSVVDAIVIMPRSSGTLRLPGQFSVDNRPMPIDIKISSAGPESISYEQVQMGSKDSYIVLYEVQNHRDSPTFASLTAK